MENVLKPPQNPVARNSHVDEDMLNLPLLFSALSMPIIRDASTLAISVLVQMFLLFRKLRWFNPKRIDAPRPPPMKTIQ